MHRSFSIAFAAALPLLTLTTAARAEQPIAADDPGATAAPKPQAPPPTFAESHPVTLRTGAQFIYGTVDRTTYMRGDTSIGIGYDFLPRLQLYMDLHYGTTRTHFSGNLDDGLRVDSQLWTRLDISAAIGMRGIVTQRGPWTLDLGGEFESSILSSAPTVESFDVATPQGQFDITPYAQQQSERAMRWYRASLSSTLRLRLGPLEPHFGVGYEYVHATLDVMLNPDSRSTLTLLGHDSTVIEAPHTLAFSRVLLMPGIDVRLGDADTISMTETLVPGYAIIDSATVMMMLKHRF